jgi:hypothetical protein
MAISRGQTAARVGTSAVYGKGVAAARLHLAPLVSAQPAMAGRPSLNARTLEALGVARLAELLLLHTEGNAAARRALRLALAETRGPQEMAQEVRKRLASLYRSERWLDRRAFAPVLAELDSQRQAITTAIGSQAPALAVELLWRLLELAPSLLDRVDDSDGAGLELFHRASADLGRLACLARLPVAALADQVAEAVLDNRQGQYDQLVCHLAEALTPEGLRRLRQRLEQERPALRRSDELLVEDEPDDAEEEGVLVPANAIDLHGFQHEDVAWYGDDWIGSFEPEDDDDDDRADDPWQRRQAVRLAMLAIADGLGEAEAYLAEYRDHAPAGLERPRLVARVAQRLTAAGRAAEALALLVGVELTEGWRSDGARPWIDAQLGALEALGRAEAAQALCGATLGSSACRCPTCGPICSGCRRLRMARPRRRSSRLCWSTAASRRRWSSCTAGPTSAAPPG